MKCQFEVLLQKRHESQQNNKVSKQAETELNVKHAQRRDERPTSYTTPICASLTRFSQCAP